MYLTTKVLAKQMKSEVSSLQMQMLARVTLPPQQTFNVILKVLPYQQGQQCFPQSLRYFTYLLFHDYEQVWRRN